MKETVSSLTKKIHWLVLPLLVSLLSYIVVMIYTIDGNMKVMQKESQERANLQEKIYETSREARTFAIENNGILTQKAEKSDVEKIDFRLTKIENTVDKIWRKSNYTQIYIPYKDSSFVWNATNNDDVEDLTLNITK